MSERDGSSIKKLHEEWLQYARNDLAFAKSGLREGFYPYVCILGQQAVEKAMKGYLVSQGKTYPKFHGLIKLHRLMEVSWLKDHLPSIRKLSEFYVPLRYPDAAGTLPEGPPGEAIASKALHWAEEIVSLIESKT